MRDLRYMLYNDYCVEASNGNAMNRFARKGAKGN